MKEIIFNNFCSHLKNQVSANSDPIRILACRAMANASVHQWGRSMLIHDVNTTVRCVAAQLSSTKHALQVCRNFKFKFTTALCSTPTVLFRKEFDSDIAGNHWISILSISKL